LGVGVGGDLHPGVGAAEHGAGGHEDELVESVDSPLFAAGIGQVRELVEDRGRVVGRGSGGRVRADGHGVDVPEEVELSWRSMVQKTSESRPAGLYNKGKPLFPRAPRHPRLMRKPWVSLVSPSRSHSTRIDRIEGVIFSPR